MSGISFAMSGIRAASVRVDASPQTAAGAVGAVRAAAPASDPPLAARPMATPIPRVYRPVRANLYSRAPGGGPGRVDRQMAPEFFSIHGPRDPPPDDDGMAAAPPSYPQSDRLERQQATIKYRVALQVIDTAGDLSTSIKNVLT